VQVWFQDPHIDSKLFFFGKCHSCPRVRFCGVASDEPQKFAARNEIERGLKTFRGFVSDVLEAFTNKPAS
jgi:hypothetical protein